MAATLKGANRRLTIIRITGEEESLPLEDKAVTIGRSYNNTLVFDDTLVSRYHTRIERDGDDWVVMDLGSKNGTFVGETRVARHILQPGDVVHVGETQLVYQAPEPAHAAAPAPPPPAPPPPPRAAAPLFATPATPAAAIGSIRPFAEFVAEVPPEIGAFDDVAAALLSLVPCARATMLIVEEETGNPLVQFTQAAPVEDTDAAPRADEDPPTEEPDGPDASVLEAALTAERPLILNVPRAGVLGSSLGVKRHLLLVPLRSAGRKLGLFALERAPDAAPFEDEELERASVAGVLLTLLLRIVL